MAAWVALIGAQVATGETITSLYEITSGRFVEIGSIAGVLQYQLPGIGSSFVEISLDDSDDASIRILNQNMDTNWFFRPENLTSSMGSLVGNQLSFTGVARHPYGFSFLQDYMGQLSYTVNFAQDSLQLDGSVFYDPLCCDIPYEFRHVNVQAVLVPEPASFLIVGIAGMLLIRNLTRRSRTALQGKNVN